MSVNDNFPALLEQSLQSTMLESGAVIQGRVVAISDDYVTISVNSKSESLVPLHEFESEAAEKLAVGDEVPVVVDAVDKNGFGETWLSHEKALRAMAWNELEKFHKSEENIICTVLERVKGGFTVEVQGLRAFLPGSLADARPVRDPGKIENTEFEVRIVKMDRLRNNIVVSRRAVIERVSDEDREKLIATLDEGQIVKGIVKNLTDYGAFVDLGGIDGLLHITDILWKRIDHPSKVLQVGQELEVKVLGVDKDRKRVSLGLKQLSGDPWETIHALVQTGARTFGQVTNVTDYGCFVEIQDGIEGLVHMSEMDWTNKNVHPCKVVKLGDEVEVMVLDIDDKRRRISLGIKQCLVNPWEEFSSKHSKDEKVKGLVKSITDFGVFIGLDGGIDGLIHMSDLSWTEPGEKAVRLYKKGDEVEAKILSIDPDRERISLGVKQLDQDQVGDYLVENPKGTLVHGQVDRVESKYIIINLAEGVQGMLRADDFGSTVNAGDEIDAYVSSEERKSYMIQLAMQSGGDAQPAHQAVPKAKKPEAATLGDLMPQIDQGKSEQE